MSSITQIIFALLRHGQAYLVYPSAFLPRPREVSLPTQLGLAYTSTQLTTSDKVVLHCYMLLHADQSSSDIKANAWADFPDDSDFIPPKDYNLPALATVIVFHGNGMNYSDMIYAAKRFVMRGCNVLLVSYRGYGDSDGSPSEKGLRRDAQAALDYVRVHPEFSKGPIILYGTSLGGAVAIDLASRNPQGISALIVENTFQSLPRVVRDWPIIGPFSFLLFQRWNSASKVPLIPPTIPILMLSGSADEVVPKKHMEALWNIAQKRGGTTPPNNDRFEAFPRGMHASTFICQGYWRKVSDFISSVVASGSTGVLNGDKDTVSSLIHIA
ncbi:Alpha/Beta hydrolase protein [Mycena rebaudengoi]|nr:Alpha/Beta hydrolase protein [Mycena rebaudengoi]